MFTDIVFTRGHENEFVEMAVKLGYSKIIFAHPHMDDIRPMPSVRSSGVEVGHALFINSNKKNEVLRMIHHAQRERIMTLVKAQSDMFNRFIVEKTDAHSLVDLEYVHKTDHLHFRRSGLDQVICKATAMSKKTVLTSFSRLAENSDKALILGRIAQNVLFCRKYGAEYAIVSFAQHPFEMKGAHDMKALLTTLLSKF